MIRNDFSKASKIQMFSPSKCFPAVTWNISTGQMISREPHATGSGHRSCVDAGGFNVAWWQGRTSTLSYPYLIYRHLSLDGLDR